MRSNRISIGRFGMMVLAILFAMSVGVDAQTPSASPTPKAAPTLEHEFLKNILRDQKAIWTSPFHLHHGDARWLGPLAIGTGALVATDRTTAGTCGTACRNDIWPRSPWRRKRDRPRGP